MRCEAKYKQSGLGTRPRRLRALHVHFGNDSSSKWRNPARRGWPHRRNPRCNKHGAPVLDMPDLRVELSSKAEAHATLVCRNFDGKNLTSGATTLACLRRCGMVNAGDQMIKGGAEVTSHQKKELQDHKPDSLDQYFAAQGARIHRHLVAGRETLGLKVEGCPGFYTLGACSFGWTESTLWTAWCEHQRELAWQRACAARLAAIGYENGPESVRALKAWLSRGGVMSSSKKCAATWPWCAISRVDRKAPFLQQGFPWTRVSRRVVRVSILDLVEACVEDQFDPKKPGQYIRAMRRLVEEAERSCLDASTRLVSAGGCPHRL